jgi:hypothetical protein
MKYAIKNFPPKTDIHVAGMMILKRILKTCGVKVLTGFIRLRIWSNGGLL